jgi:hypothetical protein
MRSFKISYFILGLAFSCSPVVADSPSPAAEQHYEQARSSLEQLHQMLVDPKAASAKKLEVMLGNAHTELLKATELRHPAAALYLAQLILNAPGSADEQRSHACSLLESWGDKGFVAAAVTNFRMCDRAYLRFDDTSPEHQAALKTLASSLAGSDPALAYYPFPLSASQCFAKDSSEVVELSQAQFRAEAEYILGSAQQPETPEAAKQLVAWLDSSANQGCRTAMDPRSFLRKLSGNQ